MDPDYNSLLGTLYQGNCNDIMPTFPDNYFTGIVTDPPYELGFMGRKWDASGVAFQIDTWKEVLRVSKPGAFLLAFGGTRTHHRLMCAIEDAGWEIRDCMQWLYGSGFPKSLDISKAIDKAAGTDREVVGTRITNIGMQGNNFANKSESGEIELTIPATPEAQEWNGYGTALKPAWEPIIVAMKSVDGTFAENALNHGVAGLNIDKSRIATRDIGAKREHGGAVYDNVAEGYKRKNKSSYTHKTDWHMKSQGRFPANIILTHHPECECVGTKEIKNKSGSVSGNEPSHTGDENTACYGEYKRTEFNKHGDNNGLEEIEKWNCHPDCPVGILDEQSGGIQPSKGKYIRKHGNSQFLDQMGDERTDCPTEICDSGGASRFFYCAKASRSERGKDNKHPTVKPLSLIKYLVELIAPPKDALILDMFFGSGTLGVVCEELGIKYVGIDLDLQYAIPRIEKSTKQKGWNRFK